MFVLGYNVLVASGDRARSARCEERCIVVSVDFKFYKFVSTPDSASGGGAPPPASAL
jgi:hypothetical protein